ncbi:MAG: DTW domain-containing protein, partial [Gammaproteobacteria bacterium]|nr:DTW domain-containing protein [Gammaproteobacteria bacterium]
MGSVCEHCGFSLQACFCGQFRELAFNFDWHVVVHPREWKRMTSSSHFLAKHGVQTIEYQRTHPPSQLHSATVLFLTDDAEPFSARDHDGPLVVLDGTWTEAKKMYAHWSKALAFKPRYVNFASPSI